MNWIINVLFIVIFTFMPLLELFLDILLTQEVPDEIQSNNSTLERKLSLPMQRMKKKKVK